MNATAALPKATARDNRTAAQRKPQTPVTVWVRILGETGEEKVHTAVGTGGWAEDALNAAVRALDIPAEEITVVAVQGGHI